MISVGQGGQNIRINHAAAGIVLSICVWVFFLLNCRQRGNVSGFRVPDRVND